MTFTYDFISGDYSSQLFASMTNALNKLEKDQRQSVKVASNDIKGGSARGVLMYTGAKAPDQEALKSLGKAWKCKYWNDSDTKTNVISCCDFLNSDEITNTQKYYSRISMGNVSGGNAYCAIFYQEQE